MARARKRHVQTELQFSRTRGGKRRGAGRPPKHRFRSSERHERRERFERRKPVHVTLRIVDRFGTLRKRDTYVALRKATRTVLGRTDFRVVHLSPEPDHIHLVVEADTNEALSKGMQAFQIAAAQYLNQAISKRNGRKRRGTVFADRYHARLIKSPTQARNCLSYVLNNFRRHRQDVASYKTAQWDVDYLSSAVSFEGWLEREPLRFDIPTDERLCVSRPRTWMLAEGWKRAGTISRYAIPGHPWRRA